MKVVVRKLVASSSSRRERARDQRVRQDRHDLRVEALVQAVAGVAAGGEAHRARAHRAAGRLQVVHAVARLEAGHRAGRMHLDAERARHAQVAVRELQRMHADAVGLEHARRRPRPRRSSRGAALGAEHARVVAEHLAHDLGLVAQEVHLLLAVRDVEVAAGLRVAGHLGHQALEGLEAGADLGVELERGLLAPALDPLRAVQPPAGVLALAAVAAGAAPDAAVGFQHGGADAVLARQEQRGGQAGEAGADDHHVGVGVAQ